MDTVEQLNETYFYDGSSNLSAGELFFWSWLMKLWTILGLRILRP